MLSDYGTEQVGISAEIAIGDLAGVPIDDFYRSRGRPELVQHMAPALASILRRIPRPTDHVAGDQNPVDFLLEGGKTLSIKSNMRAAGKIAPQKIGQPTSNTFWSLLPQLVPAGVDVNRFSYVESAILFKEVALSKTEVLLTEYWKNLFDCDYLIYVCDVLTADDRLTIVPTVRLYEKSESPQWDKSKITFSRNLGDWNESCTVKYNHYSIGEFQIHNHRNCFKFRFNLDGLITAGLL